MRPQGDQSRLDIAWIENMTLRAADRVERPVPWFYSFAPDVFREAFAYFTAPPPAGRRSRELPDVGDGRAAGRPLARRSFEGVASFELMCTNGRAAARSTCGHAEGHVGLSPTVATFENITKPTPPVEPPVRIGMLWRLLSLLSASHQAFQSGRRAQGDARAHGGDQRPARRAAPRRAS